MILNLVRNSQLLRTYCILYYSGIFRKTQNNFLISCSPLTTLRDNLVVTVLNAEGNETNLTVIQTMSIVEKVCWNDVFYLDGGGHVRLQLEFILSDEERNRIRSMREAAMKKKQGATPNVISRQSELASSESSSVMSSPLAEQMVSG